MTKKSAYAAKAPYILLSFVNAQLRDQAENLSDLCAALDVGEKL